MIKFNEKVHCLGKSCKNCGKNIYYIYKPAACVTCQSIRNSLRKKANKNFLNPLENEDRLKSSKIRDTFDPFKKWLEASKLL